MTDRNLIPTIRCMDKITAAKTAIKQAGGQSAMAQKLAALVPDLSEDKALWRIQKWAQNGVPPKFVLIVENLSGVSRHDLDPEIYPRIDAVQESA